MRYYGKLRLNTKNGMVAANKWVITTEPHVRIKLKDMFKRIAVNAKEITIKNTVDVCKDLDWFLKRYPMEMSSKDAEYLDSQVKIFDQNQSDLEVILIPNYTPIKVELAIPARNYQLVAGDLWKKKKKLLVADDVGLGKTLVGILGLASFSDRPGLVVCQTHLPKQWKDQIAKFAPKLRVHIIQVGPVKPLPEADVYICPYSRIAKWSDALTSGAINLVIYDEIQELRKSGSQKYLAAEQISNVCEYVLGLSATPIYNFGSEMHAIMNIIENGCLGDWSEFSREWCGYDYGEGKAKVNDSKALGSFLRENYLMLRRTREEVQQELPEVNKIVHSVDYDHKVAEKGESLLKQIAAKLISNESSFIMKGQAARELDMKARYLTGVAKAGNVAEYVKVFLENGEKVLLAGWHRDCYTVWEKELADYKPVMYTGSETANQKDNNKKSFTEGDSQIMFISLRSGVGLDGLQDCCSTVIFGELDWSPGVHEQVIGRLHRPGQANRVTAIFLASEHGTDPTMIDLLGLKTSQSHGILNPDQDIISRYSDEDRLKVLAQRILNMAKVFPK